MLLLSYPLRKHLRSVFPRPWCNWTPWVPEDRCVSMLSKLPPCPPPTHRPRHVHLSSPCFSTAWAPDSRVPSLHPGGFLYPSFLDEDDWSPWHQMVLIKKWLKNPIFKKTSWCQDSDHRSILAGLRTPNWIYMLILRTLASQVIYTANRLVVFDSKWKITCRSWPPLSVARNSLNDSNTEVHIRWCY